MTKTEKKNGIREVIEEFVWLLKLAFIIGLFSGSYETKYGEVNYILGLQNKSIVAVIYEFYTEDYEMAIRALIFSIPGLVLIIGFLIDYIRDEYLNKNDIMPYGFILGTFLCGFIHFYFVFMINPSFNALFVPVGLMITSITLIIAAIKRAANRNELHNN